MEKFIIENLISVREPTDINFRKFNLANQERTMDGTLVVDFISSKEAVNITWDMLPDDEFQKLMDIVEQKKLDKTYYSIKYLKPGTTVLKTVSAYAEEISYYPFYLGNGKLVWCDISISFIEV